MVIAATWRLTGSRDDVPTSVTAFESGSSGEESIFDSDDRRIVEDGHVGPQGKYRSIVKLFIRYEGQAADDGRFAMATGWLIKDDLLVTAGHCGYDWSQNGGKGFGRAVEVKVYIGYKGKKSIGDPSVQFRSGIKIVVPEGWVKSSQPRDRDVCFIQLNEPFQDVTPFTFEATPARGNSVIGVVGYPGDKSNDGEVGAKMYEEFKETTWNLDNTPANMLEYRFSTYKGTSGAPIILQGTNKSYGAHVYDGAGSGSASTIHGTYGNDYTAYISAFEESFPVINQKEGISFIDTEKGENVDEFLAEPVGKVEAVVSSASVIPPLLGPLGGSVGATLGTVLNGMGRGSGVSESVFCSDDPER